MIKAEIHTQAGTYYVELPDAKDLDEGIDQIAQEIYNMTHIGIPLKPTAVERLLIEKSNTILHIRVFEEGAVQIPNPVEPPAPNYTGQNRAGLDDLILYTEVLKQPITIRGRVYTVKTDHPTYCCSYFMPTTVKGDWIYNRLNPDMAHAAVVKAVDLRPDEFEILMPPVEFNETTDPEELDAYLIDYVTETEAEKARPVGNKTAKASYEFGPDRLKGG